MNFEITALVVFLGSFLGLCLIVFRKIPVLADLPETKEQEKESGFPRLKNKIASAAFIGDFDPLKFLQKVLSRVRILTMKIENKTSDWLKKLRTKAQKQKNFENDNYWRELKNSEDKDLPE